MHPSPDNAEAELERPLVRVEDQLTSLGQALMANDALALEAAASELHHALATAVDHFRLAARRGAVPPSLRRRLAHASARVAAQRESLARATAALDRAIDVLMPGASGGGYGASGGAARPTHSGSLIA